LRREIKMNAYFIQKLTIKDVRGIKNFDILLDDNERKHLIITGKNGSGKTSLLREINSLLNKLIANQFAQITQILNQNIPSLQNAIDSTQKEIQKFEHNIAIQIEHKNMLEDNEQNKVQRTQYENNIKSYQANIISQKENIKSREKQIIAWEKQVEDFSKVDLMFSHQSSIYEEIANGKFLLAFFAAKRENIPNVAKAIQNIQLEQKYTTDTSGLHKKFIEYMVKLRMDMLDAKEEHEVETVFKIEQWFGNFEKSLKELFLEDNLKLTYYRKELNFKIEYGGKSFGLNELSDGYSSLLAILTELILRMEAQNIKVYDMQGVVLIDEIETHLHVELQKRVLPFLVRFFPNIQFIVTTHSPFVLSSLSNAVICDLEKRFVTTDLSSYSYDALVESYFDSDKYSQEIKDKIVTFELLVHKESLTDEEHFAYIRLKDYFKKLPTFMADELAVKIKQILLHDLNK
jgi:predicted ATP-binding protein involved in virulence